MFHSFSEKIQPSECCGAAPGLSLLQLSNTQTSLPTFPCTDADSRPERPHPGPAAPNPRTNPSARTEVSARHSSAASGEKGHCKCLPLFLTRQGSGFRRHPARAKPRPTDRNSVSAGKSRHTRTSTAIHYCSRGARWTSQSCRRWGRRLSETLPLSVQIACTHRPRPWALIISEFLAIALRDSQPTSHLLPSRCAEPCGGTRVRVLYTRQLSRWGKKSHHRLNHSLFLCLFNQLIILSWL